MDEVADTGGWRGEGHAASLGPTRCIRRAVGGPARNGAPVVIPPAIVCGGDACGCRRTSRSTPRTGSGPSPPSRRTGRIPGDGRGAGFRSAGCATRTRRRSSCSPVLPVAGGGAVHEEAVGTAGHPVQRVIPRRAGWLPASGDRSGSDQLAPAMPWPGSPAGRTVVDEAFAGRHPSVAGSPRRCRGSCCRAGAWRGLRSATCRPDTVLGRSCGRCVAGPGRACSARRGGPRRQ